MLAACPGELCPTYQLLRRLPYSFDALQLYISRPGIACAQILGCFWCYLEPPFILTARHRLFSSCLHVLLISLSVQTLHSTVAALSSSCA